MIQDRYEVCSPPSTAMLLVTENIAPTKINEKSVNITMTNDFFVIVWYSDMIIEYSRDT